MTKADKIEQWIVRIGAIGTAFFALRAIDAAVKAKARADYDAKYHPDGVGSIGAAKRKIKENEYNIWRYLLYPLFLNDEFLEWYYWEHRHDEDVAHLIRTKEELDATFAMIDSSNLSLYKKKWLKENIEIDYRHPGERMSWKKYLENAEVFNEID